MRESATDTILLTAESPEGIRRRIPWQIAMDLSKRGMDILLSLLGIILLLPGFGLVALRIRSDSPGPIFYWGLRAGRNGKPFHILKFRTMYEEDASYKGSLVTGSNDPRVTKVGRWLRDSKLNELPQLWNVFIGEMSLVGPRPEDPEIIKTLPAAVSKEILSVRPGITSPASVVYRDEEHLLEDSNVMDIYLGAILPSKLRLDQLYVRHRSLMLDLDILFWTSLVLIPRVGASSLPEEWLFLGPLTRLVRRYLRWFSIDALVTLGATSLTGIFWRSFGPLNIGVPKAMVIAIGFSILYSLVSSILGINRIAWSRAEFTNAIDLVFPVGVSVGIALLANYLWGDLLELPPLLIVMAGILSYVGYVLVRYRSKLLRYLAERWLTVRGGAIQAQERVLIIGGGETGEFAAWWLRNKQNQRIFRVVGFIDDDLYKQDTYIRGVHVLGRRNDIPELVAKHDVGIILFAIHNIPEEERISLLEICRSTSARLFVIPDITASLRMVARDDPNQPDQPGVDRETLSPDRMRLWLDQLETMIGGGDLAGIQEQIDSLRTELTS